MASGPRSSSQRRGPRRTRPTWRDLVGHDLARRGLAVASVGALVAGLAVASVEPAAAAPVRALQSVDVDLAEDGTVTAVRSDLATVGGEDGSTSEEADLDPTEVVDDLPVRVLTSYRLGDRVGTDLSEIEGEEGRVEVTVTVQNLTVRPERVEYDANGAGRSAYALVGAPLTVIASAGMGEGSLASVVTEPDEDGDTVTNGLLSRASGGESQVQWAAMLAPPRLGTTATFTLVQDTDSFEVPDLDVSVQPGLVTDGSVQSLVRSAFDEDASSTLSMESSTIGLIAEVGGVLSQAGTVLGQVRDSLSGTVGNLGQRTIGELQSSTSGVTASLLGVASSIEALDSQVSGQLASTSSDLTAQLDSTLDEVRSVLGDPATDKEPKDVAVGQGCDVALPSYPDRLDGRLSIYQQVLQVRARLETLEDASGACGESVRESLLESLGSADTSTCTEDSTTATCAIAAARAGVEEQAAGFDEFRDDIASFYDSPALGDLAGQVERLNQRVGTVVTVASVLTGGGNGPVLGGVSGRLEELDQALEDVQIALQGVDVQAFSSVLDSVEAIEVVAVQQRDALTQVLAADAVGAAVGAVSTLVDEACAAPSAPASCADRATVVAELTTQVSALRTALTQARDSWAQVAQRATFPDGLEDSVSGLSTVAQQVQQARQKLNGIRAAIGGGNGVGGQLQGLAELVVGLFAPSLLGDGDVEEICPGDYEPEVPGMPEPPLNGVNRTLANVACLEEGISSRIDARYDELASTFEGFGGLLDDQVASTDEARREAEAQIGTLTEQLADSMGEAGGEVKREARAAVRESRRDLERGSQQFSSTVERGVGEVVEGIGRTVGQATRDLVGAEQQLRSSLQAVLLDLGDPTTGSGGILGALRANASQTDLSVRRLLVASSTADDFAGVRTAALDEVFLQRAQLTRSLQLQQELPAVGVEAPEGARLTTVYSFHLGDS